MKLGGLLSAPVRRSALGLILAAVVLFPSGTPSHHAKSCHGQACPVAGAIIWSKPLTGPWVAENGVQGTVYAKGQAFAAVGHGVAAVGFGLTLDAYDSGNGFPRWAASLAGVPFGASIISVRVWPGVVTAGVQVPDGSGTGTAGREEIVLDAITGKQIRSFPATLFGGAVNATLKSTVVVGRNSVTGYSNSTGKVVWRDLTGPVPQAWERSGGYLYVTVSASGVVGTAPVTAVRQINLQSGDERLIQPTGESFDGRLSGAFDGTLLFSASDGLRMYNERTGQQTGERAGAVPEAVDPIQQVLYVDVRGALIGVDPQTGLNEPGTIYPGPPGTYGVRAGVALGLDPGAAGAAWGYNLGKKHVIWTTRALPWPHFFVDLSGLGGSADPANNTVLLVTCAKVGAVQAEAQAGVVASGSGQACLRPMLVEIRR
ncbi:MAG TPA: PQQ-binding-like beta-propeller repeat protein [Streptosporangiaceae bacterium]|nr:PQQ-binding-like beta-propeller repeat protein [Streptosporangiaceae bacterium]